MKFELIEKILKKKGFFGFTVKREDSRLTYTFRSVSYFCVEIKVMKIKVNPEKFGSNNLVGSIVINEQPIKDLNELTHILDYDLRTIHKKAFVKTFKQL
jgi:hypothetical protein